MPPFAKQVGNSYMDIPVAPAFGAALPPAVKPSIPFHGVEFQPSEVCPKNFIIFDQNDRRSQVMFNPAIAHKFNGPSLNFCATYIQDNFERKDINNMEREMSSSLKEDSDDIDALLSLEEEEEEEEEEDYDEEEVSTARTYGNYGCDSPDSSSSYGTESQKNKSSSSKLKSAGSISNCDKAWSWEFEELVLLSSHGRYYEDNNNRVSSNLELMVCSCISLDFEYALPTMIG
ncbi:hypothetical protein QYF36_025935 [Acer negundo]|nr:hypothetical protein QYF36_025935 [Acer negundo]